MKTEHALIRADLDVVIVHMLFRLKLSDLSEEKEKAILMDIQAVNNALQRINELEDINYKLWCKYNNFKLNVRKSLKEDEL